MKLKLIGAGLKKTCCKAGLWVRKKSPLLLTIAGCAAVVAGEVMACKATLKMADIVEEAAEQVKKGEECVKNGSKTSDGQVYTQEIYEDDCRIIKKNMRIVICKTYAPSAIVTALGITAICCGYKILSNRYTGMVVAYEGLKSMFDTYRKRVIEDAGNEKDKEYMYGKKTIEKKPVVDENGEVVGEETVEKRDGVTDYTVIFDEYNSSWVDSNILNAHFLRNAQCKANDILREKGHVFLSEAWELVGYEPKSKEEIAMGRVCGWVEGYGDGFVDFGISDFLNAVEAGDYNSVSAIGVLLDFNCSGNILSNVKIK